MTPEWHYDDWDAQRLLRQCPHATGVASAAVGSVVG